MISRQKLDWEMAETYVRSLPDHEHTQLIDVEGLRTCEDLYTYRFGEGDHDPNRPFGFPIASHRDKDGTLWITQTTYNHHTLTAASTGLGKTQGVILNATFNADPRMSYVITDPKGEITQAAYTRLCELFGCENISIFNILNPHHSTVYYNPFGIYAELWLAAEQKEKTEKTEIRDSIVSDLNRLLDQLFPVESHRDPSWEKTAKKFILGMLLGLMEDLTLSDEESQRTGRMRTTPEMISFETLHKIFNNFRWTYHSFNDGGFLSTRSKSSLAYTYTYSTVNNAGVTRSNYLGFVDIYLARYSDPKIFEITRHNTFKAERFTQKPHVLLLIYDMAHEQNRDFLNICVGQLITELLSKSHDEAKPLDIPIHFILDEFATLRPSTVYPNLLATGRGSGIYMHMIVQSRSQLKARYPEEFETMINNCDVQFYLGSNDLDTAKQFQEALGTTSAVDSEAFLLGDFKVRNGVPIVTLDYLLHHMAPGENFVKRNNAQPLHGQYSLYYLTPEYTAYPSTEMSELLPPKGLTTVSYQLSKPTSSDDPDDWWQSMMLHDDVEETEVPQDDDDPEDSEETEMPQNNEAKRISDTLRIIISWLEEPFEYDRDSRTQYENFAMDRIEQVACISRKFSRQDAIELLKILQKLNTLEENEEILEELLNQFEIATDEEYAQLIAQLFGEEDQ